MYCGVDMSRSLLPLTVVLSHRLVNVFFPTDGNRRHTVDPLGECPSSLDCDFFVNFWFLVFVRSRTHDRVYFEAGESATASWRAHLSSCFGRNMSRIARCTCLEWTVVNILQR